MKENDVDNKGGGVEDTNNKQVESNSSFEQREDQDPKAALVLNNRAGEKEDVKNVEDSVFGNNYKENQEEQILKNSASKEKVNKEDEDFNMLSGLGESKQKDQFQQRENIDLDISSIANEEEIEGINEEIEGIDKDFDADISDIARDSILAPLNPKIVLQRKLMELKQGLSDVLKLRTEEEIKRDPRLIEGQKALEYEKARLIIEEINGLSSKVKRLIEEVDDVKSDGKSDKLTNQLEEGFDKAFLYNNAKKGSIQSTINAIEELQKERNYENFYIKDSEDLKSKVEALRQSLKTNAGSDVNQEQVNQANGIRFYLENEDEINPKAGNKLFSQESSNFKEIDNTSYEKNKKNYIKNVLDEIIARGQPETKSLQTLSQALENDLEEKALLGEFDQEIKQTLSKAFIGDNGPSLNGPSLNGPSLNNIMKAFAKSNREKKLNVIEEAANDADNDELGEQIEGVSQQKFEEDFQKRLDELTGEINKASKEIGLILEKEISQNKVFVYLEGEDKQNQELDLALKLQERLEIQKQETNAIIEALSIPSAAKGVVAMQDTAKLKRAEEMIKAQQAAIQSIRDKYQNLLESKGSLFQANKSNLETIDRLEGMNGKLRNLAVNFRNRELNQSKLNQGVPKPVVQQQNQAPPAGGQNQAQPAGGQRQIQAPPAGGQNQAQPAGGQRQIQAQGGQNQYHNSLQHMRETVGTGRRMRKEEARTRDNELSARLNQRQGKQGLEDLNDGERLKQLQGELRKDQEKKSKIEAEGRKEDLTSIKYQILIRAGMTHLGAQGMIKGYRYDGKKLSGKAIAELDRQAEEVMSSEIGDIKTNVNAAAERLLGQIAKGNLSKYIGSGKRDRALICDFLANNRMETFDKKFESALETQDDFQKGKTGLKAVGNFFTNFSGKMGFGKAIVLGLIAVFALPLLITGLSTAGAVIAGAAISGTMIATVVRKEAKIFKQYKDSVIEDIGEERFKKSREADVSINTPNNQIDIKAKIERLDRIIEGKTSEIMELEKQMKKERGEVEVGKGTKKVGGEQLNNISDVGSRSNSFLYNIDDLDRSFNNDNVSKHDQSQFQGQNQVQGQDKRDFKRYSLNDNNLSLDLSSDSISNLDIFKGEIRGRNSIELNKDMARKMLGDHDLNNNRSSSSNRSSDDSDLNSSRSSSFNGSSKGRNSRGGRI